MSFLPHLAFGFLAVTLITAENSDQKAKSDQEKVQGLWRIVSVQNPGEPKDAQWPLAGSVISIEGDRLYYCVLYSIQFRPNPAKSPKEVDFIGADRKPRSLAIYSLEQETLRVWVAKPGNRRPTAIPPKEKEECSLVVLARIDPQSEEAKLQGVWQMVSLQSSGKAFPLRDIPTPYVAISGTLVVPLFLNTEPGSSAEFTLDPSKDPKEFDILAESKVWPGIYSLEKDTLIVCFPYAGTTRKKEKPSRPPEFATREGDGQVLVKLQRANLQEARETIAQQRLSKVTKKRGLASWRQSLEQVAQLFPETRAAEKAKELLAAIPTEAQRDLKIAELLFEHGKIEPAERRFKEIVQKYPGTESAKKAAQYLERIEKAR